MSTPTPFRSYHIVLSAVATALAPFRSRTFALRGAALALCMIALTACGEATAPLHAIDRAAVAVVAPSLTDARLRLTPGIKDLTTRQQVILHLAKIEFALKADDVAGARASLQAVETLLDGYRVLPANQDGADVSAIFLALNAIAPILGGAGAGPQS